MGLYNDPDGKNINLNTTTEKDHSTVDNNISSNGNEVKELQRRVIELEKSLKQYVRKQ